jgi:hypothetical protein
MTYGLGHSVTRVCELCLPRRAVLTGAAGLVVAGPAAWRSTTAAAVPAVRSPARVAQAVPAQAGAPAIVPRAAWGPDLPPVGPVPDEPDVRFLLVHHTVNANDYAPEQVVGLLTGMYRFHTSPEKGWPDIAYNFLIDRFGTIYEGRTGSLAGPKAADATGGSQGFAQLCSFLGDHRTEPPSEAAMASMVAMLAFLGDRHSLDLAPGATTTFVSRGSNRRPAGEEVTTPTISGHRDMSATVCPGDAAYAWVADGTFARLATERRTAAPPPPPTAAPPPAETTTSAPATTATTTGAPDAATDTTTATATPTTDAAQPPPDDSVDDDGGNLGVPAAIAAAAAAGAALLAVRTRRSYGR